MRFLLFLFFLMIAAIGNGQNQNIYQINVTSLVVHSKANSESKIVGKLNKGDAFVILSVKDDWHEIKFGEKKGYILGPSLNQSEFWTKRASSKDKKTKKVCEDFTNQFDQKLNNYLHLNTGADRDLVIKLMKQSPSGDTCIRSIYIESNSEVKIKNIPEGNYYVKAAYGNNWKLNNINGICYGKFENEAIYEKGADLFDFNIVKTEKGYQVPSYQLSLEIITNNPDGKVVENQISEEEFNN